MDARMHATDAKQRFAVVTRAAGRHIIAVTAITGEFS